MPEIQLTEQEGQKIDVTSSAYGELDATEIAFIQGNISHEELKSIRENQKKNHSLTEQQKRDGEKKMATTLRESAKAYVPPQTRNVAELSRIKLDAPIEARTGNDKDGKVFEYNVAIVDGEEYRVPNSVLNNIKTIMAEKPTLKEVKVIKKGSGMSTEYTVIPLD